MITGELKSKIDAVWNDFWSGGIANPLEVMEQLTYLLRERQAQAQALMLVDGRSATLPTFAHSGRVSRRRS